MSYQRWWTARQLLYEERFGVLIRVAENEQRVEEERVAAAYRKSVSLLKTQGSTDGSG